MSVTTPRPPLTREVILLQILRLLTVRQITVRLQNLQNWNSETSSYGILFSFERKIEGRGRDRAAIYGL